MTLFRIHPDTLTAEVVPNPTHLPWVDEVQEADETGMMKVVIMSMLNKYGIDYAVAEFDGSGDGGQIESVVFYRLKDGFDYREDENPSNDMGRYDLVDLPEDMTVLLNSEAVKMDDALLNMLYRCLEHSGYDWYNNDGGYGDMVADVRSGVVRMDMNVRITVSENYQLVF